MNAKESIKNLCALGEVLEKVSNKPENYNTEWCFYLKEMNRSMHNYANELRDNESLFSISNNNTDAA